MRYEEELGRSANARFASPPPLHPGPPPAAAPSPVATTAPHQGYSSARSRHPPLRLRRPSGLDLAHAISPRPREAAASPLPRPNARPHGRLAGEALALAAGPRTMSRTLRSYRPSGSRRVPAPRCRCWNAPATTPVWQRCGTCSVTAWPRYGAITRSRPTRKSRRCCTRGASADRATPSVSRCPSSLARPAPRRSSASIAS